MKEMLKNVNKKSGAFVICIRRTTTSTGFQAVRDRSFSFD